VANSNYVVGQLYTHTLIPANCGAALATMVQHVCMRAGPAHPGVLFGKVAIGDGRWLYAFMTAPTPTHMNTLGTYT